LVALRTGRYGLRLGHEGVLGIVNPEADPSDSTLMFGVSPDNITHRVFGAAEWPITIAQTERIEAIATASLGWLRLTRQEDTSNKVMQTAEIFRHSLALIRLEADSKLAGLVEQVIEEAVRKTNPQERRQLERQLEALGVAHIEDRQGHSDGRHPHQVTFSSGRWSHPEIQVAGRRAA